MENDYIVVLATETETNDKIPQVYKRRIYEDGSWQANIIQNTFGAFDNSCIFEEFCISSSYTKEEDILFTFKE